jgi:hypothetical protein
MVLIINAKIILDITSTEEYGLSLEEKTSIRSS